MQTIDNKKLKKLEVLYKLNKLDELEKETNKLLKIDNENIVLLNIIGVVYLKTVLNRINESGYDIKLNLWVTAFRLIPGVILSWILFLFQKNKHQLIKPLKIKKNIIPLLIASFIGPFLALGCWILGYAFIDKPSLTSIIGQTSVIFIVLLSWLFLKESLTKLRVISTACVFIGVLLATMNL